MYIKHSAKGSSWSKKDHKYQRKENGRYYYAKNVSDTKKKNVINPDLKTLDDSDINKYYQFPEAAKQKKAELLENDKIVEKGKEETHRILNEISRLMQKSNEQFKSLIKIK